MARPKVDETNPWITRNSAPVYDNAWIEVSHRDVTTPTGTPGIYGLVHFKHLAVGVIPIDTDDHTWLVGQFRYAVDEYSWEIPAGGGPVDGDPAVTAHRELREECGLDAATIEPLVTCRLSNSVTDETGHLFVARDLTPCDTDPDDTEVLSLWRLPVDDAIAMVLDGGINDSLSIMGLLRLAAARAAE